MKILALFMTVCMLCLSSFGGMVMSVETTVAKSDCCHKMSGKSDCKHKADDQKDACGKQGCPMMLSCTICGFLTSQRLELQPTFANSIPKPVPLYKIGNLPSYYPSDWKPPKAC